MSRIIVLVFTQFYVLAAIVEPGQIADPRHQHEIQYIRGVFGEPVILPCYTQLEQPVVWMYRSGPTTVPIELSTNGDVINGNSKYFALDTKERGDYNLIIKSANYSHAGIYICDENNGIGDHHELYLNLSDAHPATFTAQLAQNVTLPCHLTSRSSKAEWSYVLLSSTNIGQAISADEIKYSVDETRRGFSNLIVINVQETDSGYYICTEKGGIYGKAPVVRNLSVSPTAVSYTIKAFIKDETAKLSCHTELFEGSNWYYQNNPDSVLQLVSFASRVDLQNFNSRFSVETDGPGDFNLVIRQLQLADYGLYTCIENYGRGPGRHAMLVHVIDVPLWGSTTALTSSNATGTLSATDECQQPYRMLSIEIVITIACGEFLVLVVVFIMFAYVRCRLSGRDDMKQDMKHESHPLLEEFREDEACRPGEPRDACQNGQYEECQPDHAMPNMQENGSVSLGSPSPCRHVSSQYPTQPEQSPPLTPLQPFRNRQVNSSSTPSFQCKQSTTEPRICGDSQSAAHLPQTTRTPDRTRMTHASQNNTSGMSSPSITSTSGCSSSAGLIAHEFSDEDRDV